jgi:pimeloyl-ACP methyl ester carboxylesterase
MMEPSWIEANGVALRYQLSGRGPGTVILVHELGGSLNSWDKIVPLLPDEMRVLRYDMRGAGQSEKVSGTVPIEQMCDDLRALTEVLGIAGPFAVLGAAVGGAIAARFAGRYPRLCQKLVLVGPALGVPEERRSTAMAIADRVDEDGLRAIAADVFPKAFPDELWESLEDKAIAQARWLGADPQGYAAAYRMLISTNVRAFLPEIVCPVLALAGSYDPFGTPQLIQSATAEIPHVEFRTVEGGHFMSVQSPARVAEAIIPFLTA